MTVRLNFKQIEAFRAVMATGSATRAARVLHTTQPSISRRLSELQHSTRLRLFELHHGRLRPTGDGEFLYEAIERHFLGLEKIETIVSAMRESSTRNLRVACTPTLGVGLLPAIANRLLEKYPDTHVGIRTMSTIEIEDLLEQGLVDIALTTGAFRRRGLHSVVMERKKVVCVLPLNHPLRHLDCIELPMLSQERLVSISESDELTAKIKTELLQNNMSDYFAVQTNSSITVCALAAAGIGVGIVTPYIADTFVGKLLIKPLRTTVTVELRLATPTSRSPSMLARHLIDLIRTRI